VFWGLDVNLAMPAGWHARLGLKSGLGGMTGYMTDSDWQNWDGIETNFSEASSYTDEALRLGLEGGYDLRVTDAFSMGPFLGFEYLSFQWSARDGYIQYPPESYKTDYAGNPVSAPYTPISPNTPISKVYGIGIVYQQSFVFPTLGIRATWKPFQGLGLLASFAASPLARLSETDNHVARSIIFTSTMTGGLVLAPHLRLDFEASRSLGLGLEVYYIRISNLTGDMLQTDSSGTATTDPWGAGASFEAIEGCITIRLSL
jgi:outer membrane protease